MDKLLLTLTLLAFSSGVLCNVAQNLTEGGSAADSVLPTTKVLGGHEEFYNSVGCAHQAPSGYWNFPGTRIALKLVHQPAVTWNQARKICKGDGGLMSHVLPGSESGHVCDLGPSKCPSGDLAVMTSQDEGENLVYWIQRGNIAEAWIGIHDQFEHGNWVTLTGEPLAATGYDKWLPGLPKYTNGNEDCGAVQYSGGLKNLACDHWRSYFCKVILC